MKNVVLPLFLSLFCFLQCKKEKVPLNISLYDKPLTTIQSYIQGKWRLHYIEGGICACTYQLDTANISLSIAPRRITFFKNNAIDLDTTLTWSFSNYASTYLMSWYDQRGYPYNRGANRIQNDTLVLYDPGPDGFSYYYTKIN